jgi:hypothetical protein
MSTVTTNEIINPALTDPQAAVSELIGYLGAVIGRMSDAEREFALWHLRHFTARLEDPGRGRLLH